VANKASPARPFSTAEIGFVAPATVAIIDNADAAAAKIDLTTAYNPCRRSPPCPPT
jgi:hypothetical protein